MDWNEILNLVDSCRFNCVGGSLPRRGGEMSIALRFMYSVYILQSLRDKGYYIGCTADITRRLLEHNSGYNKSTRSRRPFKIVYTEEFNLSEEAFAREKEIKSYKGGQALKKLLNSL